MMDMSLRALADRMLLLTDTPDRRVRGKSIGWDTPIGCVVLAQSKLGRIMRVSDISVQLTGPREKQVEELLESASYALRAAQLLLKMED